MDKLTRCIGQNKTINSNKVQSHTEVHKYLISGLETFGTTFQKHLRK